MSEVQPQTDTASVEKTGPGTASTRRTVLLGVGALGATAALTACGTGTDAVSNSPLPAGSPAPGAGANGASGVTLAATKDVPSGSGVIKGDYVITQPSDGVFRAFSKVCPHKGCPVSNVTGGLIICRCHNSQFSIEDGSVQGGPSPAGLAETEVKVDGDNVVTA